MKWLREKVMTGWRFSRRKVGSRWQSVCHGMPVSGVSSNHISPQQGPLVMRSMYSRKSQVGR